MSIKNKILNCFAIAFVSILFIFAFTWIIFDFQNSANALRDTWSIVSSLFGGIATLIAAYIASLLFNDWRDTQRFNIAKETLIALIRLKSHMDKNFKNAKYHLDSYYFINQDLPISDKYIIERISQAKECLSEKEKYKLELDKLLINFFENIDVFESIMNITLIKNEDREFNFRSYAFFISNMYTKAFEGELEDILITNKLSLGIKNNFEEKYYNVLIKKLKNNNLS